MSSSASRSRKRPGDRAAHARRHRRAQAPDRAAVRLLRERPAGEHRGEHRRQQVGAARVDVHPDRGGDDHVGAGGQRREHPPEGRVDRRVDVVERGREQPARVAVERRGIELREVPELVPGEVGGAEGEPGGVEVLAGEQLLGGDGDPAGRREQLLAQAQQVARPRGAEDLGRPGAAAVAASELAAEPARPRPARQHDAVGEAPAADRGPLGPARRPALIGIDRERAQAGGGEPLPDRRRSVERGRVAGALLGGRPLERIEDPVIGELDPAVEAVEGAGGEVDRRRLELDPAPARAQRGQVREPVLGEQPLERRNAGGVELQHADHAAASITAITSAPSRARASGPGIGAARRGARRRRAGARASARADADRGAGGRRRRPRAPR